MTTYDTIVSFLETAAVVGIAALFAFALLQQLYKRLTEHALCVVEDAVNEALYVDDVEEEVIDLEEMWARPTITDWKVEGWA